MKYSRFLFPLFLLLNSCLIIFSERKEFEKERQTVRFSMDYRPDIEGKLHTDGAYINGYWGYIFYPDGTYLTIKYDSILTTTGINGIYPIKKTDVVYPIDGVNIIYSIDGANGIYFIIGDTLVLDDYIRIGIREWILLKYKYLIKNPDTLNLISYEDLHGEVIHFKNPEKRISFFVPIPESELPSQFELKIRGKKWMWENKADWKAYKKQLKEYQKQKKVKNRE